MFISSFSIENREGNHNDGLLEEAKNWEEIEAAIRGLDGHRRTLVTLEAEDETHMAIGGGNSSYFVYVTFDNENFYYLVDPSKSDDNELIVVGGQEGIYPARSCVDLNTTLKAARGFAEFGKIEKSVAWAQDLVAEPA
jgi:Immunity protein Imm1